MGIIKSPAVITHPSVCDYTNRKWCFFCCSHVFPGEKSCIRLFGDVLQEYSESWTSDKIYLLEPMAKIQENNKRQAILDGLSGGLKLCSGGYATSTELQLSSIRNVSKESS